MPKQIARQQKPERQSDELIAPSGGAVSQQEDLKAAMGALHRSDRVETLSYAFEVALEKGVQDKGPFNLDAAIAALSGGYIKLKGSAAQIGAQLKLVEGSIALLRRVCDPNALSQSLSPKERIETLVYAFDQAIRAGHTLNGFYADKAVKALQNGELELDGSPEQIADKLALIQAAARLIERACQYEVPFHRPPPAMNYLRSEKWKADDKADRAARHARDAAWKEEVRQGAARARAKLEPGNE